LLKEKALKWLEEHATIELVPKGSLNPEEDEDVEELMDAAHQTIDVQAEASTTEGGTEELTDVAHQTIDVQAEASNEE
jgi:trigger factor